jgi:hypothetical protein
MTQPADVAELQRLLTALDARCDRLENLLTRLAAVLEVRDRPPAPAPPPRIH